MTSLGHILKRVLILSMLSSTIDIGFEQFATAQSSSPHSVTIGTSTSLMERGVQPSDFTLDPVPDRRPINGFIFGYNHEFTAPTPDSILEKSIYQPFTRDDPKWWDEQLDELLYARTPLTWVHGRGSYNPNNLSDMTGAGNMSPHLLPMLVAAIKRAGAENVFKCGMFIDTAQMPLARLHLCYPNGGGPGGPNDHSRFKMDLTDVPDKAGHRPIWYFWDADIQPWFDAIPRKYWYMYNDNGVQKPLIGLWKLRDAFFTNQENNTSNLLQQIGLNFKQRYGLTPFFFVAEDWPVNDPSIAKHPEIVGGVESWFYTAGQNPSGHPPIANWKGKNWQWTSTQENIYSLTNWNGKIWGASVPSFYLNSNPPVLKGDGRNFRQIMTNNKNSEMNMIEGFNDPVEGCASYRSDQTVLPNGEPDYPYTNSMLNIVREYSDPAATSIKFQAEGADQFLNANDKPNTLFRYGKALGIIPLGSADNGFGWALSFTTPNEAIVYRNILLSPGTYKFTARVSSTVDTGKLHFSVGTRDLPSVSLPNTGSGDTYVVVPLGTFTLSKRAFFDLKLTVDTPGTNIDWFFSKKL